MRAVRSATVRRLERASGSTAQLMLEAGLGAADAIAAFHAAHPYWRNRRVIIVAGRGNNGGDGIVAARFLAEKYGFTGVEIWSLLSRDELRGDCFTHAMHLPDSVKFRRVSEPTGIGFGDALIVDALLGTGIKGALKAPLDGWIDAINSSGCPVVSLDIPSGVDSDIGTADKAVAADLTVTFGLPKRGLFFASGAENCGAVEFVPIGLDLTAPAPDESEFEVFTAVEARRMLERLPHGAYKNRRGELLMLSGSPDYPDAPVLNAEGALALGCGMVRAALRSRPYAPLAPQVIARGIPDYGENFAGALPELERLAADSGVILAGSGWGASSGLLPALEWIKKLPVRAVLDADALNLLAAHPELGAFEQDTVLTPHWGEAKRLAAAFEVDFSLPPHELAPALAQRLNAVIVLKGAQTWLGAPDGASVVVASGTPALAKAGAGDVLAGVVAAALAQSGDPLSAAALGVFLHGAASAQAASQRAFRIDDLGRRIGEITGKFSPLA